MTVLTEQQLKNLEIKANEIRQLIIEMLVEAGSGHTAGALGMADIFTALFFHILKHNPKNPKWEKRDRLILSNGHICPVYYATLACSGYIPIEELKTLRKFGSKLQGHPHREYFNVLETSSGPLGSGLSQAVGMALADRMDFEETSETIETEKKIIYCLMSDAEQQCGEVWEAAMLAGKEKLNNLIAIIDRNNIQISGFTEDVMPLEPLRAKYEAFNWNVLEIDGHNMKEIINAVDKAKTIFEKPTVIIARIIPGKGVPEFENKYEWHGKPPNKKEGERALYALRIQK